MKHLFFIAQRAEWYCHNQFSLIWFEQNRIKMKYPALLRYASQLQQNVGATQ